MIRQFNGKAIEDAAALPRLVAGTKPGETVSIEVWRQGEARRMDVTVAELPTESSDAGTLKPQVPARSALGLAVHAVILRGQHRGAVRLRGGDPLGILVNILRVRPR